MALIGYKVQETGGWFYEAPTRKLKPSQTCPTCGHVHKKKLSERVHDCGRCGHTEPRDVAAARVVHGWLLEELASENRGREPSCGCASSLETESIAPLGA